MLQSYSHTGIYYYLVNKTIADLRDNANKHSTDEYIFILELNFISFNEAFRRQLSFLRSAYHHAMARGSKLVDWFSE
jgi:hypothetical protein